MASDHGGTVRAVIEARATATMPVPADEVFAAATDLEHADWLPAVRGLRRLDGSPDGVGARYAVEVGVPTYPPHLLGDAGLPRDPSAIRPEIPGILRESLAAKQRAGIALRVQPTD